MYYCTKFQVFLMTCIGILYISEFKTVYAENTYSSSLALSSTHRYHISNDKGICFLGEFDLAMKLPYTSQPSMPSYVVAEVHSATVDRQKSLCNKTHTILVLKWSPENTSYPWRIEFILSKADHILETRSFVYLSKMAISYFIDDDLFPRTTIKGWKTLQATGLEEYMTQVNKPYTCAQPKTINLDNSTAGFDVAEANFTNLILQAFVQLPDGNFRGTPFHCDDDFPISNVLPVVIGVTLIAVLVLAVGVFFIFRRSHLKRSQRLL